MKSSFVIFLLVSASHCLNERIKRDDGSFASNSGGPVAAGGKDANLEQNEDEQCPDGSSLPYRKNLLTRLPRRRILKKTDLKSENDPTNQVNSPVLHDQPHNRNKREKGGGGLPEGRGGHPKNDGPKGNEGKGNGWGHKSKEGHPKPSKEKAPPAKPTGDKQPQKGSKGQPEPGSKPNPGSNPQPGSKSPNGQGEPAKPSSPAPGPKDQGPPPGQTAAQRQKAKIKFDNLKKVDVLNGARKNPLSATFGPNKYSDISSTLFVQKLGGTLPPEPDEAILPLSSLKGTKAQGRKKRNVRPMKLNWVEYGVVPAVREQKRCGSCYALSTSDLLAAQTNIENKQFNSNGQLSPQFFLDCFHDPAAYGCIGGRPKKVLDHISAQPTFKMPAESCLPYKDRRGCCSTTPPPCSDSVDLTVRYSQLMDITGSEEKDIMAELLQHGPLVAVVGINEAWQFFNGTGIFTPDQCNEAGNHAVLVTGYDYTQQIPYYIVKNSWGTDWGENGYVKLQAGENTCDVARTLLLLCTKDCNDKTTIYDILGSSNVPNARF